MFDRRWAGRQEASTSVGNGPHLPEALLRSANSALPFKAVTQRLRASAGDLGASWPRKLAGERAGLVILDVVSHGSLQMDNQAAV